jgi:hypothetical protein
MKNKFLTLTEEDEPPLIQTGNSSVLSIYTEMQNNKKPYVVEDEEESLYDIKYKNFAPNIITD